MWWQGESNALTVANAHEYSCNQKALIQDLRRKFSATPRLPFIFVQSFPLFGDLSRFQPYPGLPSTPANTMQGLSELRLSQAESLSLPGVAMVCTIDLGDVGCPFTWQHNRAKKPCAHRAALAARALIYREKDLVYRGPEPRSVRVLGTRCGHGGCGPNQGERYRELEIAFEMFGSSSFQRAAVPISVLSFEILFVDVEAGDGAANVK